MFQVLIGFIPVLIGFILGLFYPGTPSRAPPLSRALLSSHMLSKVQSIEAGLPGAVIFSWRTPLETAGLIPPQLVRCIGPWTPWTHGLNLGNAS